MVLYYPGYMIGIRNVISLGFLCWVSGVPEGLINGSMNMEPHINPNVYDYDPE